MTDLVDRLRKDLGEERTRNEELSRLIPRLQRDFESHLASVTVQLQAEKHRCNSLQGALQRQAQCQLTTLENELTLAQGREQRLRDEIRNLEKGRLRTDSGERLREIEAEMTCERTRREELEKEMGTVKAWAAAEVQEREKSNRELGRAQAELEEMRGKSSTLDRENEYMKEKVRQLLVENGALSTELSVYKKVLIDTKHPLLGLFTVPETAFEHGLENEFPAISDISNGKPKKHTPKKCQTCTNAQSPIQSLQSQIAALSLQISVLEMQIASQANPALSDSLLEGSKLSLVGRFSNSDLTYDALLLELSHKDFENRCLSTDNSRLKSEITALTGKYMLVLRNYDRVRDEKDAIEQLYHQKATESTINTHENDTKTAISATKELQRVKTDLEMLRADLEKAKIELILAQEAWESESKSLQTALLDAEKQAIEAKVKYAEAATDRDVHIRLCTGGKKRSKSIISLFKGRKP